MVTTMPPRDDLGGGDGHGEGGVLVVTGPLDVVRAFAAAPRRPAARRARRRPGAPGEQRGTLHLTDGADKPRVICPRSLSGPPGCLNDAQLVEHNGAGLAPVLAVCGPLADDGPDAEHAEHGHD